MVSICSLENDEIEVVSETEEGVVLLINARECDTFDNTIIEISKFFPSESYMEINFYDANHYPEILQGWIEVNLNKDVRIQVLLNSNLMSSNIFYLNEITSIFYRAISRSMYRLLFIEKNMDLAIKAYERVKVDIFV